MARVNPPPIKIPPSLLKDVETQAFFRELTFHLQQLWKRTGGGTDLLDENAVDATAVSSTVNARVAALREELSVLQCQISLLSAHFAALKEENNDLEVLSYVRHA